MGMYCRNRIGINQTEFGDLSIWNIAWITPTVDQASPGPLLHMFGILKSSENKEAAKWILSFIMQQTVTLCITKVLHSSWAQAVCFILAIKIKKK